MKEFKFDYVSYIADTYTIFFYIFSVNYYTPSTFKPSFTYYITELYYGYRKLPIPPLFYIVITTLCWQQKITLIQLNANNTCDFALLKLGLSIGVIILHILL